MDGWMDGQRHNIYCYGSYIKICVGLYLFVNYLSLYYTNITKAINDREGRTEQ